MGTERNLIPAIDRLSREAGSIDEAIGLFQSLLAGELGGATLLVDHIGNGISEDTGKTVAAFLESRQFPFRGLYTAPLTDGRAQVGRLMACFASFGAPAKWLPEITAHLARKLSEIIGRTNWQSRQVLRPGGA